jgi:hypothetical protein
MKLLRISFDLVATVILVFLFGGVLVITSPFWLFLGFFNLMVKGKEE